MSGRLYAGCVYVTGRVEADWRWRRAEELGAGDPHNGLFADDELTLAAVKVLRGDSDPVLADVRDARDVYATGGLNRRLVEAYLLTHLSEAEVGGRVGLTEPAAHAYQVIFFTVRGSDPLTRLVRVAAEQSDDPLARAAAYGPVAIEVQVAIETGVGVADLPPSLVERVERKQIMDRLFDTNPAAFVRAVDRLRAIDDGLPPGVLHPRRRYTRRAGASGDAE